VPATYVVNFQFAGGVWILQTLPAVFLALFVRTLDRWAILVGWALGVAWGTAMLADTGFNDATTTSASSETSASTSACPHSRSTSSSSSRELPLQALRGEPARFPLGALSRLAALQAY